MHKRISLQIPGKSPWFKRFYRMVEQYFTHRGGWGVVFTIHSFDGTLDGYIVTDEELQLVHELFKSIGKFKANQSLNSGQATPAG